MSDAIIEQKPKRLPFLDLAKFIGLMLIIAGHRISQSHRVIKAIIHSFHVPVFFVISGYTFSFSKDFRAFLAKTLKRFLRLLIPYFITVTIMLIIDIVLAKGALTKEFWFGKIYEYIGFTKPNVYDVGALWFLIALFTTSTLFDLLHLVLKDETLFGVVCCLTSILGVVFGKVYKYTPFHFDVALAMLIFMYLGYKLKNFNLGKLKFWHALVLLLVWGFCIAIMWTRSDIGTFMSVADRRYTSFPLSFICATAGSVLFLWLCYIICKYLPKISSPLCFLGRYTIYMVCVHAISFFYFEKWFQYTKNFDLNNLIYFGIGTGIFFVILACDLLIHHAIKKHKETSVA